MRKLQIIRLICYVGYAILYIVIKIEYNPLEYIAGLLILAVLQVVSEMIGAMKR